MAVRTTYKVTVEASDNDRILNALGYDGKGDPVVYVEDQIVTFLLTETNTKESDEASGQFDNTYAPPDVTR